MGKKQKVIEEIFKICRERGDFVFDNALVKEVAKKHGFGNPFDATKLDSTSKFPQVLLEEDYFILHMGKGKHRFVKGIKFGFHEFEKIPDKNKFDWKYRKSLLNEYDTSESNILSVGSNQRIIHDFLYEDIVASPKVYNSRRTKASFNILIGREEIHLDNIQMEIDLTMEYNGVVTVFEGKNGFPKDFAVYQLYYPFRYFYELKKEKKLQIRQITACYVLRDKQNDNSVLRLYNYTFKDPENMSSIKLLKNAEYKLLRR
jgi:hypothetical protein